MRDHAAYLRKLGVVFASVEPRMSRDFQINFADAPSARRAGKRLRSVRTIEGRPLFEVEEQGNSLFVSLVYAGPIEPTLTYLVENQAYDDLHRDTVFVALKNGQHNGIGYFLDTGVRSNRRQQFPLTEIPNRIFTACGVAVEI
jgi:hypothetical protein